MTHSNQVPPDRRPADRLAAHVRQALGVPSVHLGWIRLDDGPVVGASGMPGAPAHSEALVRWASVGKLHTAVLALTLADQGRLGIDEPVAHWTDTRWLQSHLNAPDSWYRTVTMGQLLGHTSGLRDVLGDPRFTDLAIARQPQPWTPSALLHLAGVFGPMLNAAGQGFAYSDTGYVVAALMMERHIGVPFHELLANAVLQPMGLQNTYVEADQPLPSRPARHWAGDLELTELDLSFDWAGGGIVATTADLARLLHFAVTGSQLSSASGARLIRWDHKVTFATDSTAHYDAYGLGLGLLNLSVGPIPAITGAWGTFAAHDPVTAITVVGATADASTDTHRAIEISIEALRDLDHSATQ